jgi:hypothetical protein
METASSVSKDVQDKYLRSKTYRVATGCGSVYITADFNSDNSLHKIYMQRTSKLSCSPSLLAPLFRSATYQGRRDIQQAIKDHKGSLVDACDKFNVSLKNRMYNGELVAYNCSDAVARCLEIILKENGSALPRQDV